MSQPTYQQAILLRKLSRSIDGIISWARHHPDVIDAEPELRTAIRQLDRDQINMEQQWLAEYNPAEQLPKSS